jgi:tetratricopeptide (TPR) repeat protein
MGSLDEQMLKLPEFEHYISSEEFKDAEERILTFERRLEDAETSLYPIKRLVTEIVLPLLMNYATLGFSEKADILLNKYQTSFDKERIDQLVQLENIYYLLHKLDKSIEVLITAERRIKMSVVKQKNNQQLKILLSEIIQTLSSRYIEKGNLSEAKKKLEQCIDLILNLEPIYFQSIQQQLNLVSIYDRLGLVNTKLGNINDALSFFSKSLAILELLAQNNINPEAMKELVPPI